MKDSYINIKEISKAKGLKSSRSLRLEINKPESQYISREVKVNGGSSYEILFSSLEPELQQKLREAENKSTELVPLNYKSEILVTDKAKLTRNHRMNIVKAALEKRKNYKTIKESDSDFLDLYNTGLFLPKAYNFLGSISIGTLRRWIQTYRKHENADCLIPKYKSTRQGEYNTILDSEMKNILLTLLLHPSQYKIGKAIKLTKGILEKRGYEYLPCDLTFKRYADNYAYIKRSKTRKRNSKLPLFFQFHKQEDINYMIKGFCSNVEASKMITLFGFSRNMVDNFNQYFRTILYEHQRSELLKKFAQKPKLPQERVYMNTLVYLYLYDHKLYVSKTYLENKNAKKHTESERLEIKNIYLRSYRKVLSRSFEKMFHLHLADELWKYGKDFDEQYNLINKMLYVK